MLVAIHLDSNFQDLTLSTTLSVPMQLRLGDESIVQPHGAYALAFSPASAALQPAEPLEVANRWTFRNGLSVSDRSDDLEAHRCSGSPLIHRHTSSALTSCR